MKLSLTKRGENLLLITFLFAFLVSTGCTAQEQPSASIRSFQECVAAGHPIMRTNPQRCSTPDGLLFFDEPQIPAANNPCENLCGDGRCQEIVCQALGCPCAETVASCPQDCKPRKNE